MTMSPLSKSSRIYIAGHRGMVGSAIHRRLQSDGYARLITRIHAELDLTDQRAVRRFFQGESIDYIVLAAAKVGGIHANNTYRAEFIYSNLMVECNVIHEAYRAGIQRLLFLGSSCIYPRHASQPMSESCLLTGMLEPTNEPYAVAKIAGIKLCEAYNRQYGTRYRSVMPTNLYGPNDSYHLADSHLMAALIRKCHLAKLAQIGNWGGIAADASRYGTIPDDVLDNLASISTAAGHDMPPDFLQKATDHAPRTTDAEASLLLWGTGTPRREFLHVDDMAEACTFIMGLSDTDYRDGLAGSEDPTPSFYNVGTGTDHTIRELAEQTAETVGFEGGLSFDASRPDGMPRKLLDVSRISRLSWSPKMPLSQGIRETYAYYKGSG